MTAKVITITDGLVLLLIKASVNTIPAFSRAPAAQIARYVALAMDVGNTAALTAGNPREYTIERITELVEEWRHDGELPAQA